MNGPGDISLTHNNSPENCSLIAIIPIFGMSSCRGRAEAFARRLSSKLRTLGSQPDNDAVSLEDEPIINGGPANTWVTTNNDSDHTVTHNQPLRHESDSFFDFDCELESPGSPVDECEYLRLIETASNTPHNSAPESGYACTSAASSQSSTDGPYFDASNTTGSYLAHSLVKHTLIEPTDAKATAAIATNSHLADDSMKTTLATSTTTSSTCCNNCSYNGVKSSNSLQNHDHLQDSAQLIHTDEYKSNKNTITQSNNQSEIIEESNVGPIESAYSSDGTILIQENIVKELQRESQEISLITEAQQHLVDASKKDDDPKCNEAVIDKSMNGQEEIHANDEQLKVEVCDIVQDVKTEEETEKETEQETEQETEKETAGVFDLEHGSNELKIENKLLEQPLTVETEAEPEKEAKEVVPTTETLKISTKENSSHLSNQIDTTDDEDDCRPQRVRRCSSLKTGKTPPGTPGRKKIVRFADVLGLDLADIKTFLDEIPTIPKSAFEDLEISESEPPIQLGPKSNKLLMPLFQQPGGLSTFLDLVREKQVSLENAAVTDHINQTITGSVRVRNLDFHKSVHIRYTLDNWRSYADLQANYVEKSCDGFSDKFSFTLFGNSLQVGQRLEFSVRFQCKGQQFWDNNYGTNYCFQCLPTTSPAINPIQPIVQSHHTNNNAGIFSPSAGDAWCTSFY